MIIDIKYKDEKIETGDLVYSNITEDYGFICDMEDKYCFISKKFERWSDMYDDISNLIHYLGLKLIAKNKNILVTLRK